MIRGLLLALVAATCVTVGHAADAPVDAYSAAMNHPTNSRGESPFNTAEAATAFETEQVSQSII
jgi:hypothetical protein